MTTTPESLRPISASPPRATEEPPPFQVMPEPAPEQYAKLRESIRTHGVLVPIDVDEAGNVLDGHCRQAIARELGVQCPMVVNSDIGDNEDKLAWAREVNAVRRQLSPEQLREVLAAQIRKTPHWSDRRIATQVGCSHPTVARMRRQLETVPTGTSYRQGKDGTLPPPPATRTGLDGRTRKVPARKRKTAPTKNPTGNLFPQEPTVAEAAGAVHTLAMTTLPARVIANALADARHDVVQASALLAALAELMDRQP